MALSRVNRPLTVSGLCVTAALALAAALAGPASVATASVISGSATWRNVNITAVDPDDDSVLYQASPADGLWKSADGGATWAQVASFPVSSTPDDIGLSFVTFDTAGGRRAANAGRR